MAQRNLGLFCLLMTYLTKIKELSYNASRMSPNPVNLENRIVTMNEMWIGDTMELVTYVRHWATNVKQLKVKPATYDRLLTSIDALEAYPIAHKLIKDITAEDCEHYVDQLTKKGYALTTIKKQMLVVSAPLRYAYAHRQISYNPSIDLKPPSKANVQKAKKKVVAYDTIEQKKLRTVLETHEREAYAAIDLMIETGVRPGEVLALNWDDIYIERKRMYVHQTMVNLANKKQSYVQEGAKSETSNRFVPLSSRAIEILQYLKSIRTDEEFLFKNKDGTRLSYESLRYQCQIACQEADVPYYGLHVYRHTFATNQFYKGTNVKILSKILGHSETSVTYNIYIHLYGDGFDDMLAAVN